MNRLTGLVAVAALLLAGCGGTDEAADPGGEAGTGTAAEGGAATVEVATADSDLGTILVDGEGMSLYLFDQDSDGTSTCYDDCAATWPPLLGEAEASGEVDASLLGTTTRDDGEVQVTYDGWPLYYFAADAEAGDVSGQAVGDVWWVVAPDGSAIRGGAEPTGEETTTSDTSMGDTYDKY